jgi:hypothetical protein
MIFNVSRFIVGQMGSIMKWIKSSDYLTIELINQLTKAGL